MNMLYQIFIAPLEAVMDIVLSVTYSATGSYGISILLLSCLINLVLLPLFQIAEKWQEAERKIQNILKPKLQEFRQAFSGEERYVMIHTLYRQTGYHPIYAMRSSVGLLLQLPFWIAGYQLLSEYAPLEGTSFLVLNDLGKPDRLLGGVNLLPLGMTGLNLLAAFLYTKQLSVMERIQPILLAALFLVLLYQSPAGLLLYWTFNSLFSLLRIALLNPSQDQYLTPVGPALSPASKPSPSLAHEIQGHADVRPMAGRGEGQAIFEMLAIFHETILRLIKLPITRYVAIFAVAAGVQVSVHKQLVDATHVASSVVLILSGGIVVYVCLTASLSSIRGIERNMRGWANAFLTWALLMTLIVINVAYVFDTYRFEHPGRSISGVLLGLLLLTFVSPLCEIVPLLRRMVNDHKLYAVSMGLSSFTLFVANPVSLYVSSSDFAGGIYTITGMLLLYCALFVLILTGLYILPDKAAKNAMTLLSVFAAFVVVSYSAIGIQDAGVMSEFILPIPEALIRTHTEIFGEIIILLMFFVMTTYITLNYARSISRVIGLMVVASVVVVVVQVYGARNEGVAISDRLPHDNAAIAGFSKERNVLVVMLDGFPGGYIETIRREALDTLKEYEGFVWYPNMLTTNSGTLGSIATLAGGHRYTVQEVNNRSYASVGSAINEAYGVYAKAFIDAGYEVTYANPAFAGGCDTIDHRVHCTETGAYGTYYHKREAVDAPFLIADRSHLPLILSMISLFKASPFVIKGWIYDNGRYRDANSRTLRAMTANAYKAKEWGFLRVLARERNIESKSKTFKFVQLSIPHPPNALNAECTLQPEQATILTESICALKELGVLLAWLKEKGAYDATKIVVVSDHGWWIDNPMFPRDFGQAVPEGRYRLTAAGIVQSLLLVKDFGAKGSMRQSDTFISNPDVPSIVCSKVVTCQEVGPDPLLVNLGERTLTFTVTTWPPDEERAKKHDIIDAYEVKNSIFDARNWKKVR